MENLYKYTGPKKEAKNEKLPENKVILNERKKIKLENELKMQDFINLAIENNNLR